MMKKLSILAILPIIMNFSKPSSDTMKTSYLDIEDQSSISLLNPDLKMRKTAKIQLANGLQVYLISDPEADQSSASLAVSTGSWDDPEEYPGMAHFCEHMLFMGTAKYPDVNDFMNRVSDFGGITNAYTAPHRTVYMFSCKHEGFVSNLDRFSRFFIDPLFNPDYISRELHAVDQEYAKNLENDRWREYMVFKETGNPQHPNRKFSSGNSETLKDIPQSALKNWHEKNYSANKMHLFIYSNLPIDELKLQANALFSEVPVQEKKTPQPPLEISSSDQKGKIIYIHPITNRQSYTLSWELPLSLSNDPTKSADLVAYALNRGQSKSLYEKLKKEQLIDSMQISVDDVGGKNHRFFFVNFDLTEKGLKNIQTVTLYTFEAIEGIKKSGIPEYLYNEKNAIAKTSYQYQTRQDAFQIAEMMGGTLPDEDLSTFPRNSILSSSYSKEKIEKTLELLKPQNCAITLTAPKNLLNISFDRKERWFSAEYTIQEVPAEWLTTWQNAKPNPDIAIAPPNPFLPSNFDLVQEDTQKAPSLLSQSDKGVAYYSRASQFLAPEAIIHLHIRTPQIQPNPTCSVLTSLYLDHLTDLLGPTLSAAKSAGLKARFDLEKINLHLQISGFNDKAPLLLEQILNQMPKNPPTKEQFEIYVTRHKKAYLNGEKALPLWQAKDLMESLLRSDRSSFSQKLKALEAITYEEFLTFHKNLFSKTYLEALFTGNLSKIEAQKSWEKAQSMLAQNIYSTLDLPEPKVLKLSNDTGPYSVEQSTNALGNATILTIDLGDFSLKDRASQEILGIALKEAFFNELRTKQKTGYIVKAEPTEIQDRLFQLFLVQSSSHQPEDLLYRFELFIEEYVESFKDNISLERFENLKHSAIHSLKTRWRNLNDLSTLYDQLAFEKDGNFDYVNQRIQALEELSYEELLQFSKKSLGRNNHRRLAVLYSGRLNTPFVYEPIQATELVEKEAYVAKNKLTPQT